MHRFLPLSVLLVCLASPCLFSVGLAQETGTTVSPEKQAYRRQARAKVLENWQAPDVDSDVRLSVYFRVDRDGKVSKIEVKTLDGSKSEAAERAATEAIRRAQPFAPVPQTVDPYYVDVRFPLKLNAKTAPTPRCLPLATFIAVPTDKQPAVQAALRRWGDILKDRGAPADLFKVVSSRDQADLVIEVSSDAKLPRLDKIGFVGDYMLDPTLSTGTVRLGLKDRSGADLSAEQLTNNTLQLLGRVFGLPGTDLADTVMSSSRFAPQLTAEEGKLATDTVKAAACPADKVQRGFVVREAAPDQK
jgi:TonB family protein